MDHQSQHPLQTYAKQSQGPQAEAHSTLLGVVERDPQNARAWYLLSQTAELPVQRQRYLERAMALGYTPAADTGPRPASASSARSGPVLPEHLLVVSRQGLARSFLAGGLALLLTIVLLVILGLVSGAQVYVYGLFLFFLLGGISGVASYLLTLRAIRRSLGG